MEDKLQQALFQEEAQIREAWNTKSKGAFL
jgi:hypothetical protein